ncbi:MAG: TlpA family protein disulfide reductase [Alphaproteobacteria bacterium]|nr:TlpA family protein disulfide reductase [Alphaproteobacteria bacterium]
MATLVIAVVVLAAASVARADPRGLVWVDSPKPIPDSAFADERGVSGSLADYAGRVILVNFWATWCAPCWREMASLDRLQGDLGGPRFQVVALSLDRGGAAAIAPFYAKLGITRLPILIDQDNRTAEAFGVVGLPTTVLIDHRGREVARLVGEADWSGEPAKATIRKLTAASCGCGGPKADRIRRYGTVGPPPEDP